MQLCRAVVVSALAFACGGRAEPAVGPGPGGRAGGGDLRPEPAPAHRLGDNVTPRRYEIELAIDPDKTAFTGKVAIEVSIAAPTRTIWLHASNLTISRASVDRGGRATAATVRSDGDKLALDLPAAVGPGAAVIRIDYRGAISDRDVHGVFRQKAGERWYVYSQFEAVSARAGFPAFDEPRWKVPFELTLIVPRGMVATSNAPIAREQDGPGTDQRTIEFAPTRPLTTYLVGFAVGPFDVVDGGAIGRNRVPSRILVPAGRAADGRFAVEANRELLSRLEDYFDSPYPYDKLDSVAIPAFFGAMEHPGMITYGAAFVLARPVDEGATFKRGCAEIIAHELAHQWFGNLVTLSWWDDIWLNESFANWLGYKVVNQWRPAWRRDALAVAELDRAMTADSLITARKIRQSIDSDREVFSAFDEIAYLKGMAVIAMFESWIGEEPFRRAMRGYMAEHAWKTTTADDFLRALAAVSSRELRASFVSFLDQPGFPEVAVDLDCPAGGRAAVTVSQQRFLPTGSHGSAAQTWQLPICVRHAGSKAGRQCSLVTEPTARIELAAERCPDWVVANAGAAGYYRVRYSERLARALIAAGNRLTPAERILFTLDAAAMVDGGKLAVADALAMVPRVAGDADLHVAAAGATLVAQINPMVERARRPNYERFVRKMFGKRARELGWKQHPGDRASPEVQRDLLLLVGAIGNDGALGKQAVRLTGRWLRDRESVPPDLVDAVLAVAARHGDAALHQRLLDAFGSEKDPSVREKLATAIASFRDPALMRRSLQHMLDREMTFTEIAALLTAGLEIPENREVTYEFVKANFDAIAAKLPAFARRGLAYIAIAFCDAEHRADAEAFLAPRVKTFDAGDKALAQVMEKVDLCIARRAVQAPAISAFLGRY